MLCDATCTTENDGILVRMESLVATLDSVDEGTRYIAVDEICGLTIVDDTSLHKVGGTARK